MKRVLPTLILAALVLWGGVTASQAAAAPTVPELFEKMKVVNPGLKDYQADIDIVLKVKFAMIGAPLNLNGKYYYKKPDKYKMQLERSPKYLQKYPQIFGWNLPELKHFDTRVAGEEQVNGETCYHVVLTPKHEMADLVLHELWINKEKYTFPKQVISYKDNGKIEINVKYTTQNTFQLFDKMSASFSFPKANVSATADASYSNYKTNINLSDSIFADVKK